MASNAEQATDQGATSQGHGSQVAKHYNELQEGGLAERAKSRIFYLRNFNNWTKSMAIAKYLGLLKEERGRNCQISVLDLCSGKGGDLLKWKKGEIRHLVCADIAGTSVEQSESRYDDMQKRARGERRGPELFSAEFITADCTKTRLKTMYRNPATTFDLVSCQFSFHYSFESYEQADMMLRNACEGLRMGGYFIGTTPNANELVKRLRASDSMSYGNDVYKVTFKTDSKTDLPIFGCEYDFHLEGVVNCPEFLVHIPLMKKLAEKYGMELVECSRFDEFFEQNKSTHEGRGLLGRMQALEPYPAEDDVELVGTQATDYAHVTARIAEQTQDAGEDGQRQHRRKYGTLSVAEWEATSIYLFYAFRKVKDISPEYHELPKTCESTPTGETQAPEAGQSQVESPSRKRPLEEDQPEEESPSKKLKPS